MRGTKAIMCLGINKNVEDYYGEIYKTNAEGLEGNTNEEIGSNMHRVNKEKIQILPQINTQNSMYFQSKFPWKFSCTGQANSKIPIQN